MKIIDIWTKVDKKQNQKTLKTETLKQKNFGEQKLPPEILPHHTCNELQTARDRQDSCHTGDRSDRSDRLDSHRQFR